MYQDYPGDNHTSGSRPTRSLQDGICLIECRRSLEVQVHYYPGVFYFFSLKSEMELIIIDNATQNHNTLLMVGIISMSPPQSYLTTRIAPSA